MWTKSTGLNWDIPCGELAQDSFLEWNEPPGTMSRWQESVAALLSRDSLTKGMHRKSRFEHSCTSHSLSQHMCLNGYPQSYPERRLLSSVLWYYCLSQLHGSASAPNHRLWDLDKPYSTGKSMDLGNMKYSYGDEAGRKGQAWQLRRNPQFAAMNIEQSWNKVFKFLSWIGHKHPTVMLMQEGLAAYVVGFQLFNRLSKVWSVWWQTGRMQRYSLGHTRGWESILQDDCFVLSIHTHISLSATA